MTNMPVIQIAIFKMGFKNLLPAIAFLVTKGLVACDEGSSLLHFLCSRTVS